jgi:putative endonuclease
MGRNRVSKGRASEDLAADFLRAKGYTIVTRNFAIRGGEIDLVAMDSDILVFVEVRFRQDGHGLDSIGASKVESLVRAGNAYRNDVDFEGEYRFDLISVSPSGCEHFVDFVS